MHGAGIEGIGAVAEAQKPGALFECFGPHARDLFELQARGKGAVFVAVVDDVLRQLGAEAGYVGEQLLAGSVDFDAHSVDAAGDDVVELVFQRRLVDVVLVLADADRFGLDLDQFGKRVHQAAADRYRPAHGEVVVGELFPGDRGGRINRGAAFVDHHDLDIGDLCQRAHKALQLPATATVANCDRFGLVLFDILCQPGAGRRCAGFALTRIDGVGEEEFALCVQADQLAARAVTGIEGHNSLAPERRSEQ